MVWWRPLAIVIHAVAVPLAWISPWLALGLIMLPAAMYFIPDRQVEKLLEE